MQIWKTTANPNGCFGCAAWTRPEQLIRQAKNLPAVASKAGHDVGEKDLSALFGANLGPMTMLLRIEQHRWIDNQNRAQHRALSEPGENDF